MKHFPRKYYVRIRKTPLTQSLMEVGAKCIDTIDGKSSTIYIAGAIALKNALCNIIAIVIL